MSFGWKFFGYSVAQNFPEKFLKKIKKSMGGMQKFFEKMGKSKKKRWEKSYASKTVPSKNPIFEKKSEKK
jgi:hypothetical protein